MRSPLAVLAVAGALALAAPARGQEPPAQSPPGPIDLRARIEAALQLVLDPARFHAGTAEALLGARLRGAVRH